MKRSFVFVLVFILMLGAGCAKQSKAPDEDATASVSSSQSLPPSADPASDVSGEAPSIPSAEAPDEESAVPSQKPSAPPSDAASEAPTETPAASTTETTPEVSEDLVDGDETDYFTLGEALLETESIGPVRLWMTDTELMDAIGQPDSQTEPELWGADGSMHSVWSYVALGLYIDMLQYEENSAGMVFSITASDPCVYETHRGIMIGDTKDDVLAAYADVYNPLESESDMLILGSIFSGMLVTLENDIVTGFFIGAMAE